MSSMLKNSMKKLLICGDSFAADWTVKYSGQGWPNMLSRHFLISNIAKAGVGEYKIYQQLCSQDLDKFDAIVIAHTSPFRIYVKKHPLHHRDLLHDNCDFIYSDLKGSEDKFPEIRCVTEYFENYFDQDYAKFVHDLICEKIEKLCDNKKVVHLINFEDQYKFKNSLNFVSVFQQHRGSMNHFNETGNQIVFESILEKIQEVTE